MGLKNIQNIESKKLQMKSLTNQTCSAIHSSSESEKHYFLSQVITVKSV